MLKMGRRNRFAIKACFHNDKLVDISKHSLLLLNTKGLPKSANDEEFWDKETKVLY